MNCTGCNGHGLVGNILDTDQCPFCFGTGEEQVAKEQFAKVKVVIERTYLIPIRDGRSVNGDTAEEVKEYWFGDPAALNRSHVGRDSMRLGGADTILSAEITDYIDVPDGTI